MQTHLSKMVRWAYIAMSFNQKLSRWCFEEHYGVTVEFICVRMAMSMTPL